MIYPLPLAHGFNINTNNHVPVPADLRLNPIINTTLM